ncbi:alkaline phosphatase PhoX [Cellulomonas sp. KRMCY2]|uniref:alkaline phosphatase PhoX n=1 Tax=Cellulomonas sp. KRMCY2 TaxID=1304865 RepID=UPI00045EA1A5|nr:alkaline phosphatase PhoX [Cellulomonas sp. KRMCY2]
MSAWQKTGLIGAAATLVGAALAAGPVVASGDAHGSFGDVDGANPRSGIQDNVLAQGLTQTSVAWGSLSLTNPDTANGVTHYGYVTANGGPLTQDQREADKTEPDKNVYLVLGGHHYLYQGHEGGPRGYVTRVDLDQPDPVQRVSLVADADANGQPLPTFDGITWDPFSGQLLLTAEAKAPRGGVFGVALDSAGDPTTGVAVALPALGSGGYEGVQNDSDGNIWLVEDIGGPTVAGANGKAPNSYLYRFTPTDTGDLTAGGTLQALQVARADGTPVTASQLAADPADPVIGALHTYGTSLRTTWVTVHEGTEAFDATAAAAAAGATPFKRPENGVFRPGSQFGEFYFTETGDTSATSTLPGAFGAVFRLTQSSPSAATGTIAPVFVGDLEHTGLDNIAFAGRDQLLVVEDAGDTLHAQRNALDSGYLIRLGRNDRRAPEVTRWLAEGRDASALYDATTSPGYNDGDNEITGITASDGDPTVQGLLGAKVPNLTDDAWRVFWTQQHGDNVTWELSLGQTGHGGDRSEH